MKEKQRTFYSFSNSFQQEILTKLTNILKKGESVQLIGPPGIGNSLLLDALIQVRKINEKYFGSKNNYKFISIDGNELLERNPSALLKQLSLSIDVSIDTNTHEGILLSRVQERINNICQKNNLIIVIDHVEELNDPILQPFFNNLYKIYRSLEHKICFVIVAKQKIEDLQDIQNFGQLSRVFLQNFLKNQPFNNKDSIWFINENAKRLKLQIDVDNKSLIYQSSGGYPRTIKRILEAISRSKKVSVILENPSSDPILSRHLGELSDYPEYAKNIPLFVTLDQDNSKNGETIGNIRLENNLTKHESALLKLLVSNKTEIVSREKGIEAIWDKNSIEISDHAYDQIVHRLRKKLKSSEPKVELRTVRGRGHRLIIK